MGLPSITYDLGGGPVALAFQRGPQDFIAEDAVRRNDNISTSGLRESLFEATDILITFKMPALRLVAGGDFIAWKNFYAGCLPGIPFKFSPNVSVTVATAPWSGAVYFFSCVIEDKGFKPKRVGLWHYSLECKFRLFLDGYAPFNSGAIMEAFAGLPPA